MNSTVLAKLLAHMDATARRPLLPIGPSLSIEERWHRLRMNYATFQALVDAGHDDWMTGDPYQIADWVMLFTPIEAAAWSDIRSAGLPLWPQLPVGRFFLDFGNPVTKVALECDGRQWHSAEKDAPRDAWLRARGWTVFRVPGWRCNTPTERPDAYHEADVDERALLDRFRDEQTMVGVIRRIEPYFTRSALA